MSGQVIAAAPVTDEGTATRRVLNAVAGLTANAACCCLSRPLRRQCFSLRETGSISDPVDRLRAMRAL